MALGSALTASLYQLVAKRTLAGVPPAVVNAYRNLYVCVVFGLVTLAAGWPMRSAGPSAHAAIALAAFIGPFLHSLANLEALANLPLVNAALVAQTQPVFVLLLSTIALGAVPSGPELAADALVLAGVAGLIVAGSGKAAAKPKAG
jgi:drug/metabolite transporter (DMT)-like permease